MPWIVDELDGYMYNNLAAQLVWGLKPKWSFVNEVGFRSGNWIWLRVINWDYCYYYYIQVSGGVRYYYCILISIFVDHYFVMIIYSANGNE